MADTNDGDIKAEIGVVCYLARKATKAQKELESEEEFKFTKLEYAAIYADGSETPQVWAGPVPALYLWESRLTSGILRGDQSLNHWEREGEGNVVLSDDRITRLSILGHQIHLLRKAKPVAVSVPIASGSGSRAHIQPIIKPEPVDAAVPIAPSSEPASTSRRSSIEPRTMHKPFQISGYWKVHRKILAPGEERQPVTAKTLQEPLVFNDCIRLLQKRIEASELLDEQAPFLCLPSKFGDGFWDQLAAYGDIEQLEQFTEKRVTRKKVIQKRVARTTAAHSVYSADFSEEIISWSDIMKECGFPDNNQFKENMFMDDSPLQLGKARVVLADL
ncbi:hypothetical protein FFLO_03557 [Filobasidium floriforme]|uniref:Uncharacterized protein n=1 Tax=Filobasidium floriforme TaxID=5210 RepID=A0A8K0NN48_9TREE|nr:uncharacterized protein HD553DRAFT_221014 [Filobasidium floriforme]KAG7535959.1 hypothetical protein FFLO_03557 [Filobasidium floriforme]KAH8086565.1 hypothetical protein HD553DRAFT_221014 [Filobasidium floriforme]